jgi:hypothetical protein
MRVYHLGVAKRALVEGMEFKVEQKNGKEKEETS